MRASSSLVFWVESVLAVLAGFVAILTLAWRDWIEGVFGVDPDRHSGSLEWEIVIVALLVTVVLGALARREWRHAGRASEA